jgi:predicted glycosyltransferase
MRIWIDLGNSPHVPFFLAISTELNLRGHEIVWTARAYAQTVELAKRSGIEAEVFGTHGGKNVASKGAKFLKRVWDLYKWARDRRIDLVLSHNSQEPLVTARLLGIKSVNMMDYEHHPGNHISFRTAKRLIVPKCFPVEALRRFGVQPKKLRTFDGIKEDVYLSDFKPDAGFASILKEMGIDGDNILIVVRPHASEALYHRGIANPILDTLLDRLSENPQIKVILLPRKARQGKELAARHQSGNIIIPHAALDGANLIAAADLVVSGGGTMNREAAALGIPVATIFAGKTAAVDEYLVSEGRMSVLRTEADIETLPLVKKGPPKSRGKVDVRNAVVDLILDGDDLRT